MHCHCGTNNRAPRLTFTDPCKPEVRPGAREESASPAWLAAPAMTARDTKCIYGGLTMDVDGHYIGSVTATTHKEKRHNNTRVEPLAGNIVLHCQLILLHFINGQQNLTVVENRGY